MRRHRYTVTFTGCDRNHQAVAVRVLAGDHGQAVGTAVAKHYGPDCWFLRDNGMDWYGQVIRSIPERQGGGRTVVTGRVRVDAWDGWPVKKKEVEP